MKFLKAISGKYYIFNNYWPSSTITKCFPGGSDGKNLLAMKETRVQSLGWEDLLEKGMDTHFNQRRQWQTTPVFVPGESHR